ncbi:MAG: hypothetical protein WBC05_07455 [Sedimentisphaerales bacterium]
MLYKSMLGKAVKRWFKMIEARDIMKTDVISSKRNIRILKAGRRKQASGVNLIEVMAVTAILLITVLGTSGYRYYSSLNARLAGEQIIAARVGQLVCGTWAGVEGNEIFDLTASLSSNLTVETLTPTKSLPSTFVLLGEYRITLEGVAYDCVLAWKDVTPELRAIWVSVEWDWREEDPSNPDKALRKSFIIITYV